MIEESGLSHVAFTISREHKFWMAFLKIHKKSFPMLLDEPLINTTELVVIEFENCETLPVNLQYQAAI